MKYLRFLHDNKEDLGILTGENKIIPFKMIFGNDSPQNFTEFVEQYSEKYEEILSNLDAELPGIELENVIVKSPVKEPKRGVICVGTNYKEHIDELPEEIALQAGLPKAPIYFFKLVNEPVGPGEEIIISKDLSETLDYEVELAIIIGKEGKDIPKEKAEEYIFGYTILNDVSVRELQIKHAQWFKGKSVDNTCPVGPYVVGKEDIQFPVELDIKCYVNGELRQNSNTRQFIFDIPHLISDLSRGTTLKPGDIIATGTPSGVGMGMKPTMYLKSGDEVRCVIEKIGELVNTVKMR